MSFLETVKRVFRRKDFLLYLALLAALCVIAFVLVNYVTDRTVMTLLHTLCYVAMFILLQRIGQIVMQCSSNS